MIQLDFSSTSTANLPLCCNTEILTIRKSEIRQMFYFTGVLSLLLDGWGYGGAQD